MKPSHPAIYGPSYEVKQTPAIINGENAQASKKAKARFPHAPLSPSTKNGEQVKMKTAAYTPGGPAGS